MAEPTGVETPIEGAEFEEYVGDYTSESAEVVVEEHAPPVLTGPAAGTGRRKEAIARVRIVPGTRQVDDQRSSRSTRTSPTRSTSRS